MPVVSVKDATLPMEIQYTQNKKWPKATQKLIKKCCVNFSIKGGGGEFASKKRDTQLNNKRVE